jgi:hypothetical protein
VVAEDIERAVGLIESGALLEGVSGSVKLR